MAQTMHVTGSTGGFDHLTVETPAHQGYMIFAGIRVTSVIGPMCSV
jgi:hypothetical protein